MMIWPSATAWRNRGFFEAARPCQVRILIGIVKNKIWQSTKCQCTFIDKLVLWLKLTCFIAIFKKPLAVFSYRYCDKDKSDEGFGWRLVQTLENDFLWPHLFNLCHRHPARQIVSPIQNHLTKSGFWDCFSVGTAKTDIGPFQKISNHARFDTKVGVYWDYTKIL